MRGTSISYIDRKGSLGGFTAPIVLGGIVLVGCLDRPVEELEPRTTSVNVEIFTQGKVDKIDILFAIDNSLSMADKQDVLAAAVPDLIDSLVNPVCVELATQNVVARPDGPLEPCPQGSEREFEPITDIHVGIISSSLGSYGVGAGGCGDVAGENDRGRLLERSADDGTEENPVAVPTYDCAGTGDGCGFLAWDPAGKKAEEGLPPGITDGGEMNAGVADLVRGVGQNGCGYEAQLESWLRFLVDPSPYASVGPGADGTWVKTEEDDVLLAQRQSFLRPDSLVAVILLSDENDCSVRPVSNLPIVLDKDLRMSRSRSECATNPNDDCCAPCGASVPDHCPPDSCESNQLDDVEDDLNLRCFAQKKRFGFDALYPTQRYVNALTQPMIDPTRADLAVQEDGNAVPNPLFFIGGSDVPRPADLVFFAGIVGVPYQSIARRNADGQPDLNAGLDAAGLAVGGTMNGEELTASGTWAQILGIPKDPADPQAPPVPPTDPLMIESVEPRTGESASTGTVLAGIDDPLGNSVNGNERNIAPNDDLQYACVFDLDKPRSCADDSSCDCYYKENPGGSPTAAEIEAQTNPLCAPDPDNGGLRTLQVKAKAYPSSRQLEVLKGVDDQGIVASVCPAQLDAPDDAVSGEPAKDYGYRPAIGAIVERLKTKLQDRCLPETLTPDESGFVSCLVLEARKDEATCSCDGAGRVPVGEEHQGAVDEILKTAGSGACVCEIQQLGGEQGQQCRDELAPPDDLHGWCYVDATTNPPLGAEELVSHCSPNERRVVRFVGDGEPTPNATIWVACSGE